jgi:DNA-binding MarR family transcriptional regulator
VPAPGLTGIDRARALRARRAPLPTPLTPGGREALERHVPAVDAVGEALLSPLSGRERETLLRLLRRVIGA